MMRTKLDITPILRIDIILISLVGCNVKHLDDAIFVLEKCGPGFTGGRANKIRRTVSISIPSCWVIALIAIR